MSHYGILLPGFWGGETGQRLAERGGTGAQVLALYLTANPDANMIGLYPIELVVVKARIATMSTVAIVKAMMALEDAGFADYDDASRVVWVREMAKFRLGLHVKPLDRKDNRIAGVAKLYQAVKPNPFLKPFFDRYGKELHITRCRDFEGARKFLGRGLQGASKALPSQETETVISKQQGQDQEQAQRTRRFPQAVENFALVLKLAHGVIDDGTPASERKDALKDACGRAGVAYDADVIRKALDSVEHRRESA